LHGKSKLAGNLFLDDVNNSASYKAYLRTSMTFNGTGNQTIRQSSGTGTVPVVIDYGKWTIDNSGQSSGKSVSLLTDLTMDANSNTNLILTQGTFDCNNHNLQVGNTYSQTVAGTIFNGPTLNPGSNYVSFNANGANGGTSTPSQAFNLTNGTFNAPTGNLKIG
jgi:hypothetical protein